VIEEIGKGSKRYTKAKQWWFCHTWLKDWNCTVD